MVHFVGAGPGAEDLITLRGARLLQEADVIIYAGSLVNPELLAGRKADAEVHDSAALTLEEVIALMKDAEARGKTTVRLHTGDPSIYGAVREQMDLLDEAGIAYDVTPGVSSFTAAAAAMNLEFTLPEVSQTVIVTRMAGRTPVPERESIERLASHGAGMAVFLSAGMTEKLSEALIRGGYPADTPAAVIYRASWPDERCLPCTVGTLAETAAQNGITRHAMILVGEFAGHRSYARSKLYDPAFTTGYRRGTETEEEIPAPSGQRKNDLCRRGRGGRHGTRQGRRYDGGSDSGAGGGRCDRRISGLPGTSRGAFPREADALDPDAEGTGTLHYGI